MLAFADQSAQASLVERASDVFYGEIDIRTGANQDTSVAQYTVLTTEVLKGTLTVPAIVVVELPDPDLWFSKGDRYLFLTRFDPVSTRYLVDDPETGLLPGDTDSAPWVAAIADTGCTAGDDVLMWGGTIYARQMWNQDKRFVPRETVGESVGEVAKIDWALTACSSWIADGMASRIPVGTAVHRMKAYDPHFRVVVRLADGHRHLYQAVFRESATVGSDLLDLHGNLVGVEFWPPCDDVIDGEGPDDCGSGGATLDGQDDVDSIAGLLEFAIVAPDRSRLRDFWTIGDWAYGLVLTFADGSQSGLWFDSRDGSTASGLQVPIGLFAVKDWIRPLDFPDLPKSP